MGRSCSSHATALATLETASMGRSCSSHATPLATLETASMGRSCSSHDTPPDQKKRFKDNLKASLKAFNINPDAWEHIATDQTSWRYSVHKGVKLCEERRTAASQQKRQARKARNQGQVSHVPCPSCHRTFRARIGSTNRLTSLQLQDDWSGSHRLEGRTKTKYTEKTNEMVVA